jgi:hypothetical protein
VLEPIAWRIAGMREIVLLKCARSGTAQAIFFGRASSRMSDRGNAVAETVDGRLLAPLGGSLRAVHQPVVDETLPEPLRNLLDALGRRRNEVETTSGSAADDEASMVDPRRIRFTRHGRT